MSDDAKDGVTEKAQRAVERLQESQPADSAMATLDALPDHSTDETQPTAINGRYVIQPRKLGQGGMAVVHLAQDRRLDRQVALKQLLPENFDQPSCDRFVHEARTIAKLTHPGIVPIHDFGYMPDGRPCYAMEVVHGRTLKDILDALRASDAVTRRDYPLSVRLRLFSRVCLTIAYAHSEDLAHRDIKPGNIMVGAFGQAKVLDWGLSKTLNRESGLTVHGQAHGTAGYWPPEQAAGRIEEIGTHSDVWSLGIVLFEILTLRRPAMNAGKVDTRSLSAPADRSVPEALLNLVRRALKEDPTDRRALTAQMLSEEVDQFLDWLERDRQAGQHGVRLLAQARERDRAYRDAREDIARRQSALRRQRSALPIPASESDWWEIWETEHALADLTAQAEKVFSEAVLLARQSIEEANNTEARRLLADLYLLRLADAERSNDRLAQVQYQELAKDADPQNDERLARKGELEVVINPSHAEVRLERQIPFGPLLKSQPGPPMTSHLMELDRGSYVASITADDRKPVRVPVRVEVGRTTTLSLSLPPTFAGHEEFVYVHGGVYVLGGDAEAPGSMSRGKAHIDPFLLGRHPVTLEAYLEFLNALLEEDPAAAWARAPRSATRPFVDIGSKTQRFEVPAADPHGDPWHPRWPVVMVSWHDAVAYCAWRSAREGVSYRLPSDTEWEAAARGADQRIYPWGNGFEPVLCRMSDTDPGRNKPVPVGSHPLDVAPCGAMDMGGLVGEWTSTRLPDGGTHYYHRGGSFLAPASWCRAATRRSNSADDHPHYIGFRLVRALR